MSLPLFGSMILGPVVTGERTSFPEITAVVNSATTGVLHPVITVHWQMINPTGGVGGNHPLAQMFAPQFPGDGPSNAGHAIDHGTMMKQVSVLLGTEEGPLPGPSTADITITIDDGMGNNHVFPVLMSGGAAGEYLTQETAQLFAPIFSLDPDATYFFGWDTTTAFPSPWALTSLSISGGDPGDTGTLWVEGMAGETEVEFTLDDSGAAVVPINPPVLVNENSTYDLQTSSSEGLSIAGTVTGYGAPPALDIPVDGAPAGDGLNPVAILQISNDGGKTWSSERPASMGKIGDYRRLVKWAQGGRSNNRCYRMICSEPVDAAIVAVDLDAVSGT